MATNRISITDKTRPSMVKVGCQPENPRWTEFYELYYPYVRAVAMHQGLELHDAEDVAQKVMAELARKLGDFVYDPSKGSFRGFLKTVTRRRVMDWKSRLKPQHDPKKRAHRPPGQEARTCTLDRIVDEDQGEQAAAEESEWRAAIMRRALATLKANAQVSDSHYQIFEAIARGMAVPEICASLGVTPNTVSVVKCRLRPSFDAAVKAAQGYIDAPQIPDGDAL